VWWSGQGSCRTTTTPPSSSSPIVRKNREGRGRGQ
jgi:hypothetical protein